MNTNPPLSPIKAIIGLGNPGKQYYFNRHNIGFRVIEELAKKYNCSFKKIDDMELATLPMEGASIFLIMPQTFMNASGKVIPYLLKKGLKAENILVIHDELELPEGKLKTKMGGSSKGHNGLKSIIQVIGSDFPRLALGIGRPANREDVPEYVLQNFKDATAAQAMVDEAVVEIENNFLAK